MPRKTLWLALSLAAAFALYAVNLGRAPIYLHEAEVLFALHAHSIATTLHDTNGRLLPLYFQMPSIGENVWFHPVIVYAMVPFLKVLPVTEAAIRLPSVFLGLTDLVLDLPDREAPLSVGAMGARRGRILRLTPAHFIHSRMAMDYLYPIPFVLAWLLCLMIYIEHRRPWMLFVATSFLGIGFFSYIASVILMPIYVLMTWLALYQSLRGSTRTYVVAAAGFAWPLVILAIWVWFHPSCWARP